MQENFENREEIKSGLQKDISSNYIKMSQKRIANALEELGLNFTNNTRIEKYFIAEFVLPKEQIIIEYVPVAEYMKTDDTLKDRRLSGKFAFRNAFFKA